MASDNKLTEIARGLLEKTKADKASWDLVPGVPDEFVLELPMSKLFLARFSSTTVPDKIRLQACTKDGMAVVEWWSEDGDLNWELASELYTTVYLKAGGRDAVLVDIQEFLRKD